MNSQAPGITKQERPPQTGSILNLNLGDTLTFMSSFPGEMCNNEHVEILQRIHWLNFFCLFVAKLSHFCVISDRSKAEMDLKELSETVQQKQGATVALTSPKRQIKSRFQLNLDKTIESCKAQLG